MHPGGALGAQPVDDFLGVEAHLSGAPPVHPGLVEHRLLGEELLRGDRGVEHGVTIGVPGDTDGLHAVVMGHEIAQERQRPVIRAGGLGRVAGDDEHLVDP